MSRTHKPSFSIKILYLLYFIIIYAFVSCSKVSNPISVSSTEYNLSGKAQQFTLDISGDYTWEIICPDWIQLSQYKGTGSNKINVTVSENLYSGRDGVISICWEDQVIRINISQSPIFTITTEVIPVYTFYGYADKYELFAEAIQVELYNDLNDNDLNDTYQNLIPSIEKELSQDKFNPKSLSDGSFVIPGFSLSINGKQALTDLSINVNQSRMENSNKQDMSYYTDMSRDDFINLLKGTNIEHSMLASWPDASTIRFEFALSGKNDIRYYICSSLSYDIYATQLPINYSLLNFAVKDSKPTIGTNEYNMIFDRFEGRKFKDESGNEYVVNVLAKKIQDIAAIDLLTEQKTCPYEYNPSSTYPIISITKNNELLHELVATMYVEFTGTSLNDGNTAYCTGFTSEVAINGDVIRIDFESGVDDNSTPWFQFVKTRLYNYSSGGWQNHESEIIKLTPINDIGEKHLAGISSTGN